MFSRTGSFALVQHEQILLSCHGLNVENKTGGTRETANHKNNTDLKEIICKYPWSLKSARSYILKT